MRRPRLARAYTLKPREMLCGGARRRVHRCTLAAFRGREAGIERTRRTAKVKPLRNQAGLPAISYPKRGPKQVWKRIRTRGAKIEYQVF
jgi:hypothetical protein